MNSAQFRGDLLQGVKPGCLVMDSKNVPTVSEARRQRDLAVEVVRLRAENARLRVKCDNLYALVATYVDPAELDSILGGRAPGRSAIM